jgi:hypothetical protein
LFFLLAFVFLAGALAAALRVLARVDFLEGFFAFFCADLALATFFFLGARAFDAAFLPREAVARERAFLVPLFLDFFLLLAAIAAFLRYLT